MRSPFLMVALTVALLTTACAPAQDPASDKPPLRPAASPKQITVAVPSDFNALSTRLVRSGSGTRPGAAELEGLVHAGLSQIDPEGLWQPQLAEAVPTTENGLWTVFPDGTMETTWKIRQNAVWQDGTPFTAQDLIFTAAVGRDPEVASFRDPMADLYSGMSAPAERTLSVRWKRPFIDADKLFGIALQLPLPRHLLEGPYRENKEGFDGLPYWSEGFVGLGPYKVREWLQGSHLILEANDRYVLGRPRINVVEAKFFTDPNVVHAAVLADGVDLIMGSRATSFDHAVELQTHWSGVVHFEQGSPVMFWPQMNNPTPAVIADVRFRRALLQAIDRQELADALVGGRSAVAHSNIPGNDPEFKQLMGSAVQHPYDPRNAAQAIEALGYAKGSDGVFRTTGGEALAVEIRSSRLDILRKTKLAVADAWQRVGLGVEPVDDPEALRRNREHRATFPGFDTARAPAGVNNFQALKGSEARRPENRFVGRNTPNYMNPELDALIERFLVTIPPAERMRVAGQIVRHLTGEVVPLPTFFDVSARVMRSRLQNVTLTGNLVWNAHLWDAG